MAGSAKPTHSPFDPCHGADRSFSYPAIAQCAGGPCGALGLTRVAVTACDQSLPRP